MRKNPGDKLRWLMGRGWPSAPTLHPSENGTNHSHLYFQSSDVIPPVSWLTHYTSICHMEEEGVQRGREREREREMDLKCVFIFSHLVIYLYFSLTLQTFLAIWAERTIIYEWEWLRGGVSAWWSGSRSRAEAEPCPPPQPPPPPTLTWLCNRLNNFINTQRHQITPSSNYRRTCHGLKI